MNDKIKTNLQTGQFLLLFTNPCLQDHVKTWEGKMIEEKEEALRHLQEKHNQQIESELHNLQKKHDYQIESFKRQFSHLEAQLKASEAIHIASKKEAKVLKGRASYKNES